MDGTATSKKQADAQLKRLRRERGVDGLVASNSALVYSLNQALNMQVSLTQAAHTKYANSHAVFLISSMRNRHIFSLS